MAQSERRRQVLRVLRMVAESVEGIERPALLHMMPALRQAQAEIERDLQLWLGRQDGSERFTAQRHRGALLSVKRALIEAEKGIGAATFGGLKAAAGTAGALAVSNLAFELERFGAIFEGSIIPVAVDEAAIIARGNKILFRQFKTSAMRYAGNVGEDIKRELVVARLRSESMHETANRLRKVLPERFRVQRYWADRLARTETMNAYNEFHLHGLKRASQEDDRGLMARWDASFDFRRCPQCASLDGQVADVANGEKFVAVWFEKRKKGMRQFRREHEKPTAHPGCRCGLVPWRATWPEYADSTRPPAAPAAAAMENAARKLSRELQAA